MRVVEDVEAFDAQLQATVFSFAQHEILEQSDVPVIQARVINRRFRDRADAVDATIAAIRDARAARERGFEGIRVEAIELRISLKVSSGK